MKIIYKQIRLEKKSVPEELLSGNKFPPSTIQNLIADSNHALQIIFNNFYCFNKRYEDYEYGSCRKLMVEKVKLEVKKLIELVESVPLKEDVRSKDSYKRLKELFYSNGTFLDPHRYNEVRFEALKFSKHMIENLDYLKLTPIMIDNLKKSVFIQSALDTIEKESALDTIEKESALKVLSWQKVSLIGLIITSVVGLIFFRKSINEFFSNSAKLLFDSQRPDITPIVQNTVKSSLARS